MKSDWQHGNEFQRLVMTTAILKDNGFRFEMLGDRMVAFHPQRRFEKEIRNPAELEKLVQEITERWMIYIAGYGAFLFEGTEAEAEDLRLTKARWEGSRGAKERIIAIVPIREAETRYPWDPNQRNPWMLNRPGNDSIFFATDAELEKRSRDWGFQRDELLRVVINSPVQYR